MDLTPKQEAFAQHYTIYGDATAAYREAYDVNDPAAEWLYPEACRLKSNPKIAARVKELRAGIADKTMVTLQSITQELMEIKTLATSDKQYSPAVAAVMGIAKIHGLMVDKIEASGKNGGSIVFKTVYEEKPKE